MRSGYADEEIEFEDEMRVGTRTELGRKWSPIGHRPNGKQKIGYEYLYLYVSLKPNARRVIRHVFAASLAKNVLAFLSKSADKPSKLNSC